MKHATERIFNVKPAYDCIGVQPCVHGSKTCIPGTSGSHGRHNAEMHMTVRGAGAEVSLAIGTGWDLPTAPERRDRDYPRGYFVELHTARPRYEGQDGGPPRPDGTCKDWVACYMDAGYLMSDEPARLLVTKGSEAVWEWLENVYARTQDEMDELTQEAVGPCVGRGRVSMGAFPNTIRVYEAKDGWRWRMQSRNGLIVADSGQSYRSERHARRAAVAVAERPIEVAP